MSTPTTTSRSDRGPTIAAFGFAAVLFIVAVVFSSGFASAFNIRTLLITATIIGFAALGQTLVVLSGGIDLSIPWTVALGGIGIAQLSSTTDLPLPVIVVVVVGLGAIVGLISGLGVTMLDIPPIVMTLGIGGVLQGLLIQWQSTGGAAGGATPQALVDAVATSFGPLPLVSIVWLVAALAMAVVLGRSRYGRRLYATGLNDRVAALAGIRATRLRLSAYIVSGAGGAVAGILLAGYTRQAFLGMGTPYLFTSIAAVALGGASLLGGIGTYWGTVAGTLVLTLLTAVLPIFQLGLAELQIVYGVVILLGLLSGTLASKLRRPPRTPEPAPATTADAGTPA